MNLTLEHSQIFHHFWDNVLSFSWNPTWLKTVFFLQHFPGLDIFLESLGLVKAWLQRTLGQLQAGRKTPTWCFFFCRGCRLEQSQGGARRIGGEGKGSCVLCLSPSTRWGTEWPIGAGTFALRASSQKKTHTNRACCRLRESVSCKIVIRFGETAKWLVAN